MIFLEGDLMVIEKTNECHSLYINTERVINLRQCDDWVQLDKKQAAQLIEVMKRWVNGEEIE